MEHNALEIRGIPQIEGKFRIPSFQRGYRWERRQVEQLLDDLLKHANSFDSGRPYYLQPIVVAPADTDECSRLTVEEKFDFDLIDGQQRLTTLYLILQALRSNLDERLNQGETIRAISEEAAVGYLSAYRKLKEYNFEVQYELLYETRKESRDFIKRISQTGNDDPEIRITPDHLYMWHAYRFIDSWLKSHQPSDWEKIAEDICEKVRIIWYQLSESVPDWKKFKDLNAGKIPLTNSELIKAIVLQGKDEKELSDYEQNEIVSQWDEIERELADKQFWYFLTQKRMEDYPTRIDILFDLIAGKTEADSKDEFFTFRYFQQRIELNQKEGKKKRANWDEIHAIYRRLRDWYLDHWTYHRIGYLVAIDKNALQTIYERAYLELDDKTGQLKERHTPLSHSALRCEIEEMIRKSIRLGDRRLEELTYTDNKELILRILSLYNILLSDNLSDKGVRYPFHLHNGAGGGWSLEHVHAQNSEDLRHDSDWKTWVSEQLISLQRIKPQLQSREDAYEHFSEERYAELVSLMQNFLDGTIKGYDNYKKIVAEHAQVTMLKDNRDSKYDLHSIANLALLTKEDNSMLNKSTFDVKRMKIASKSSSNFVPIGTERVFMKALPDCNTSQMFFWGETDRSSYIDDIKKQLSKYLVSEYSKDIDSDDDER